MRYLLTKLLIIGLLYGSIPAASSQVRLGAERVEAYLPLLKGKKVALAVNQTSIVGRTHLLDTLLTLRVDVRRIFAPEHGFRGDHSAGASVKDGRDQKTGISVKSLYGKSKKPSAEDLADVDIVIFDIQDVGVRFYTYISTLHYIMQACAEQNKAVMVLDRPNPNDYFIDGPVLEKGFESFVGMHPVPLVHGMTIGEYARMINGEGWAGKKCSLTVIPMEEYKHGSHYKLPVPPSPNLSTMAAVYLYPSLGLFEGTDVSVGRGTDTPFEIIGKPGFEPGIYAFTPRSIPGKAEDPPHKDSLCLGFKVADFVYQHIIPSRQLYLYWLEGFYKEAPDKSKFFNPFFDKLAGTDKLRKAIEAGQDIPSIRDSWKPGLDKFFRMQAKYMLYD